MWVSFWWNDINVFHDSHLESFLDWARFVCVCVCVCVCVFVWQWRSRTDHNSSRASSPIVLIYCCATKSWSRSSILHHFESFCGFIDRYTIQRAGSCGVLLNLSRWTSLMYFVVWCWFSRSRSWTPGYALYQDMKHPTSGPVLDFGKHQWCPVHLMLFTFFWWLVVCRPWAASKAVRPSFLQSLLGSSVLGFRLINVIPLFFVLCCVVLCCAVLCCVVFACLLACLLA